MSMSYARIKQQVRRGMYAGAEAARRAIPITQCPFGVCRGVQDESHSDILISSWVLGYMEETIQLAVDAHYRIGADLANTHGEAVLAPGNKRVKQALVDGFTHAVMLFDLQAVGTLQ